MGTELTQKLAATVIPILTQNGKPLQVLLGQAEVTNWLKSTPEQPCVMRYPGEFKFPGGGADNTDASLCYTAVRELNEEFLLNLAPEDVCLLLFNIKTTKAIKGVQFIVHQFLALSEDNPWLQAFETESLNSKLRLRREEFFSRHFNEDYASVCESLRCYTRQLKGNLVQVMPDVSDLNVVADGCCPCAVRVSRLKSCPSSNLVSSQPYAFLSMFWLVTACFELKRNSFRPRSTNCRALSEQKHIPCHPFLTQLMACFISAHN